MTRGTLQFDASFIHYSAISDVRRVLYGVKIKTARARVPSQEVGTNQPAVANVRLVKTRSVYFVDFCGESKQHVGIWGNGLQLHSIKSALYGAKGSASCSGYFINPFNVVG